MKLALVCDAFPPKLNSSAIHMADLVNVLESEGHQVFVFTTNEFLNSRFEIESKRQIEILRVKTPSIEGKSLLKRLLVELLYPVFLFKAARGSRVDLKNFNGVICYSPSIFFSPFIWYLKYKSKCKSYLIVRDVFPNWALDLGLISKFTFSILNQFAVFQYKIADRIGVNSPSSIKLLEKYSSLKGKSEVLWTWLPPVAQTKQAESKVSLCTMKLIYSGNMGVAQDIFLFGQLAKRLKNTNDFRFSFYGRGSQKAKFQEFANDENLSNIQIFDEVEPSDLKAKFLDYDVGIVALDLRHRTSNIPGKFLSYMEAGLPVLAKINPGNDLINLIQRYDVGVVVTSDRLDEIESGLKSLRNKIMSDDNIGSRCQKLANEIFSSDKAAQQIISLF